jgi:hypothetical protein
MTRRFFDENGTGGGGGAGEEGFPLAQQPRPAPSAPPSEFATLSLGEVFAAAKSSADPVRTR